MQKKKPYNKDSIFDSQKAVGRGQAGFPDHLE